MCIFCVAAAADRPGKSSPSPAPFIVAYFVHPVLWAVPGLGIKFYSYGVMVAAALGTATLNFAKDLQRASIDLDEVNCFFVFLTGFGVGSKAHLALSAVGAGEPLTWKSFDIRTGHSFIGSQIGAVLCMLAYIRYKKVKVLLFLDVLLPCCLLGHVIGKIGCFLSGDGCYGPDADPRDVPWAMSFPNASVPTHVPVHPTPIYESITSLSIFILVNLFCKLPAEQPGRRTALTLVLYGAGRVVIEQYRRNPAIVLFGGLSEYQVLALALLVVGFMIESYGRTMAKKTAVSEEEETPAPAASAAKPSKSAKSSKTAEKKKVR